MVITPSDVRGGCEMDRIRKDRVLVVVFLAVSLQVRDWVKDINHRRPGFVLGELEHRLRVHLPSFGRGSAAFAHVRRLAQATAFAAGGKPGAAAGTIYTLDFTFSDFGAQVSVTPPPAGQIDHHLGVAVQY